MTPKARSIMSDKPIRRHSAENRNHTTGDAGILTGPPTVAGNGGAEVRTRLLAAFQPANLATPEWMRLPAPRARCLLTGLSRTGLNEAIERGEIRAITVRQPGATRGVKLVNVASVRAWLTRLDAEQNTLARETCEASSDVEGGVR
jgi:hypothetical protein